MSASSQPVSEDERRARLARAWEQETTADRDRIAAYLAHRGLPRDVLDAVGLDVVRYHPALPYFDSEGNHLGDFSTMLAKVTDVEGKGVSLHRTYLSPDGPGKLDLGDDLPAKKLMTPVREGATKGASIKLCALRSTLGIAEGIETALAVIAATGQHVWAALCATGLETVELPGEVVQVHVWADRDESKQGLKAAERAALRFRQEGRTVFVHLPGLLP